MVITIINNKGGTGKTTTCVNLSTAFAQKGYRVLLVDLDPQASASLSLGITYRDLVPSAADVLFQRVPIHDVKKSTDIPGLDILTGEIRLVNTDLLMGDIVGREERLKTELGLVKEDYDLVLCDSPPSFSLLSINALLAADSYIVPVTPEYLALEGLISLMDGLDRIKSGMSVDTKLLGILFTMVVPGALLNRESRWQKRIIDLVSEQYGDDVFNTVIKRNTRLAEAPSFSRSIFEYDRKSSASKQYLGLANEVLERCGLPEFC